HPPPLLPRRDGVLVLVQVLLRGVRPVSPGGHLAAGARAADLRVVGPRPVGGRGQLAAPPAPASAAVRGGAGGAGGARGGRRAAPTSAGRCLTGSGWPAGCPQPRPGGARSPGGGWSPAAPAAGGGRRGASGTPHSARPPPPPRRRRGPGTPSRSRTRPSSRSR